MGADLELLYVVGHASALGFSISATADLLYVSEAKVAHLTGYTITKHSVCSHWLKIFAASWDGLADLGNVHQESRASIRPRCGLRSRSASACGPPRHGKERAPHGRRCGKRCTTTILRTCIMRPKEAAPAQVNGDRDGKGQSSVKNCRCRFC